MVVMPSVAMTVKVCACDVAGLGGLSNDDRNAKADLLRLVPYTETKLCQRHDFVKKLKLQHNTEPRYGTYIFVGGSFFIENSFYDQFLELTIPLSI